MGAIGLVLLGLGCASTEYRPVDRQLDLSGRVPAQAEQVRICVPGAGVQAYGARLNGRFAVTGLPQLELPVLVTVDAVDAAGVMAQWQGSVGQDYSEGEQVACAAQTTVGESGDTADTAQEPCVPCQAAGGFASDQEESWVLGLRFLD